MFYVKSMLSVMLLWLRALVKFMVCSCSGHLNISLSGNPTIIKSYFLYFLKKNLNDSHDTLYMYWAPSPQKPENILLLAKNTKAIRSPSSNVYKSINFGRTWNNINDKLKINSTAFALIDQIYISKVNPLLVS